MTSKQCDGCSAENGLYLVHNTENGDTSNFGPVCLATMGVAIAQAMGIIADVVLPPDAPPTASGEQLAMMPDPPSGVDPEGDDEVRARLRAVADGPPTWVDQAAEADTSLEAYEDAGSPVTDGEGEAS